MIPPPTRHNRQAYVASLKLLASRRLTEAQLRARLTRKGFAEDDVRAAVATCKMEGFVDDVLYARLFVDGRAKAVGDARLIAELVRRGIDGEAAKSSVTACELREEQRLGVAADKLFRARASLSYPSAARALERLGFPAPLIYRHLRARASQAPGEDSGRVGAQQSTCAASS